MAETCEALWEPQMRPRDTHDCDLPAGHDGQHQCTLCRSSWDKPKAEGGTVTING